jgi:hypothetical protein
MSCANSKILAGTIIFVLSLLCLIPAAAETPVESLNDDTIRAIYAENDAAIKDTKKTVQLIKERFDDGFVLKSDTSVMVGGVLQKHEMETKDKDKIIEDTSKAGDTLDIKNHQHKIVAIRYTADKKYAYVSDVDILDGFIKLPLGDGKYGQAVFKQKQYGVDKLEIIGAQIKIMSTERRNEISIER